MGQRRREERLIGEWLSRRNNIRAIDQIGLILSNQRELYHRGTELFRHLCLVEGKFLPDAGGGGIVGEVVVGFEA
jgi:hypothetical protein